VGSRTLDLARFYSSRRLGCYVSRDSGWLAHGREALQQEGHDQPAPNGPRVSNGLLGEVSTRQEPPPPENANAARARNGAAKVEIAAKCFSRQLQTVGPLTNAERARWRQRKEGVA
jgi:hypothetical protein